MNEVIDKITRKWSINILNEILKKSIERYYENNENKISAIIINSCVLFLSTVSFPSSSS